LASSDKDITARGKQIEWVVVGDVEELEVKYDGRCWNVFLLLTNFGSFDRVVALGMTLFYESGMETAMVVLTKRQRQHNNKVGSSFTE